MIKTVYANSITYLTLLLLPVEVLLVLLLDNVATVVTTEDPGPATAGRFFLITGLALLLKLTTSSLIIYV